MLTRAEAEARTVMAGVPAGPVAEADEMVVLVDAADRAVGAAPKLAAHRAGLRHRAHSVFVRDGAGRMLLQRRARTKYHSGGLWSNACCGHPRPGEPLDAAAARRLFEELGLACDLEPIGKVAYEARFDGGMSENEVVTLFCGRWGGPVRPDPAEAEEVAWVAMDDLLSDVRTRPALYTVWFRKYLTEHLDLLEDGARCAPRRIGRGAGPPGRAAVTGRSGR